MDANVIRFITWWWNTASE